MNPIVLQQPKRVFFGPGCVQSANAFQRIHVNRRVRRLVRIAFHAMHQRIDAHGRGPMRPGTVAVLGNRLQAGSCRWHANI